MGREKTQDEQEEGTEGRKCGVRTGASRGDI